MMNRKMAATNQLISILLTILALGPISTISQKVELDGLGTLEGTEAIARGGSKYFSFKGVPYAEPPTGMFRFRPAMEVQPWEGVKEAKEFKSVCTQMYYKKPDQIIGEEDCLYVNVYTKNLDPEAKLPVVYFIHGGAFIFGGTSVLEPDYMMEEDIVFVTVQYRLNAMGFFTTEDKNAPGNYGLQDQLAALRWINKHISSFGGDPNLVTISGISAGGASVHYLLLSPNSAGLFHRAVALSGSALCWWANLPNQRSTAKQLGASLDCPTVNSAEMVDCIRKKPIEEIMMAQAKMYPWRWNKLEHEPMNMWSPRADAEAGNTAILPIQPHLAMEVGQIQPVPFLVGVADNEGSWRAINYLYQDDVMMEFMKDFDKVAPLALGLENQVNEENLPQLLSDIKDYYLDAFRSETDLNKRLSRVVIGMSNMLGDTMFNYPIDRMVKLHGNKDYAPVWMYVFNYKCNHSLIYEDLHEDVMRLPDKNMDSLKRASHAAEAFMFFPMMENIMGKLSEEETKVSRKFVKFIVEFAKKGDPTMDGKYEFSEWKPVANGQITHFIFGKYSASQVGLPFQPRMKWWNDQPAFWKKDMKKTDSGKKETTDSGKDELQVEEIVAEELSEAEIEELEVNKIMNDMKKDEL